MNILNQIRQTWKSPLAAWTGCVFGATVPVATYLVAHYEAMTNPMLWGIVLGGLLVSAPTVYQWAEAAFQNKVKSLGFVMLLEGTMILSGIMAIALACLGLLVVINAVGAAACLARKDAVREKRVRTVRQAKVAA